MEGDRMLSMPHTGRHEANAKAALGVAVAHGLGSRTKTLEEETSPSTEALRTEASATAEEVPARSWTGTWLDVQKHGPTA